MKVVVTPEGIDIDGHQVNASRPPAYWTQVLGQPDRIVDPAPPAPVGHRNNQVHMYDRFGVYLNEHHARRLIEQITFVLWAEEAIFKPAHPFQGELLVDGSRIVAGMTEQECAQSIALFDHFVGGFWGGGYGRIWIGFMAVGHKRPGRRRSRPRYLVDFSVAFADPK
jgi:hypothetical protein